MTFIHSELSFLFVTVGRILASNRVKSCFQFYTTRLRILNCVAMSLSLHAIAKFKESSFCFRMKSTGCWYQIILDHGMQDVCSAEMRQKGRRRRRRRKRKRRRKEEDKTEEKDCWEWREQRKMKRRWQLYIIASGQLICGLIDLLAEAMSIVEQ